MHRITLFVLLLFPVWSSVAQGNNVDSSEGSRPYISSSVPITSQRVSARFYSCRLAEGVLKLPFDFYLMRSRILRDMTASVMNDSVFTKAIQQERDSLEKIGVTPPDSVLLHLHVVENGRWESVTEQDRQALREKYQYDMWVDGKRVKDWSDWATKVYSGVEALSETSDSSSIHHEYVGLCNIPANGEKVEVHIRTNDGRPLVILSYQEYPRPVLITPFFEEQKQQVTTWLENGNRNLNQLPFIPWEHYQLLGPATKKGKTSLSVPFMLDIEQRHHPIYFLMGAIPDSVSYQFQVVKDGDTMPEAAPWVTGARGSRILELSRLPVGSYRVNLRFDKYPSEYFVYHINLRPRSYRDMLIGVVIVGGILLIGGSILLLRQKLRFRKRERRLKTDRQLADLQNQVYRSQLNPHFIFNALSSIQSLMNKGEIVSANDYLSDFAGLLRTTLDAQKSEFWTLDDELNLLKNYVKLEQLRFSFSFDLTVQEGIIPINHAFPAMLLQPVVENAIRHGLLYDGASTLTIRVRRTGTDLVIAVEDNGRGFDPGKVQQGDGLRLTYERIDVINRYGSTFWELSLQTRTRSTTAFFTGKHYFQDDETRA